MSAERENEMELTRRRKRGNLGGGLVELAGDDVERWWSGVGVVVIEVRHMREVRERDAGRETERDIYGWFGKVMVIPWFEGSPKW